VNKLLMILILTLCVKANATIFAPIDSTVVKKVELSNRFQNRIAFKDGRISQLVHPGCDIDINLDEEIGQVFIFALTHLPLPSSLTVITDSGMVQDFELIFVDKPGEIVILEENIADSEEVEANELCLSAGSVEYQVNLVNEIKRGVVPDGFVACTATQECKGIKNGLNAVLISKFVSLYETIYILRINNTSRRKQRVSEREVNFLCGDWIYLDRFDLCAGDHTLAIIGVKND
jgi:hypothetical protein